MLTALPLLQAGVALAYGFSSGKREPMGDIQPHLFNIVVCFPGAPTLV